jgi:hypothetical protein
MPSGDIHFRGTILADRFVISMVLAVGETAAILSEAKVDIP